MIKLWSINSVLRYTGFRVILDVDTDPDTDTLVGVEWYGLPGSLGWDRIDGIKLHASPQRFVHQVASLLVWIVVVALVLFPALIVASAIGVAVALYLRNRSRFDSCTHVEATTMTPVEFVKEFVPERLDQQDADESASTRRYSLPVLNSSVVDRVLFTPHTAEGLGPCQRILVEGHPSRNTDLQPVLVAMGVIDRVTWVEASTRLDQNQSDLWLKYEGGLVYRVMKCTSGKLALGTMLDFSLHKRPSE